MAYRVNIVNFGLLDVHSKLPLGAHELVKDFSLTYHIMHSQQHSDAFFYILMIAHRMQLQRIYVYDC